MQQKIIITGASGGFGFLTCETLIANGHQVVGTMRSPEGKNQDKADQLKALGVHVVEMDVTNEQSVNSGIQKGMELLGGLDVVINNAGLGVMGMQEHFTPADMQKVFDVNVLGVQRV
ncbi:MAG: SDR family NAD(P)-dependent oxidoreductase, partial [Flavobacteriales bacterium]|nr:SDR family NAD(P)-dependent oxidoreductase [Flavobacteriales bacterium]